MAIFVAMFVAMSTTVNIAEFKNRFSELLSMVERGDDIVVCRRNIPVARVAAIPRRTGKRLGHGVVGCMKGSVEIHGDLTDACIDDSAWDMHR